MRANHEAATVRDEEEIVLYVERAKTVESTLGDAAVHRGRFAGLTGF